jgi:HopA1 effector protein family
VTVTDQGLVGEAVREDVRAGLEVADRHPDADQDGLAGVLYGEWYLAGPLTAEAGGVDPPSPADLNLVDALRAAHADDERWLDGWVVAGVSNRGRIAVSRGGRDRVLARVDVLPRHRPGLPPRVGDEVQVTARRDTLDSVGAFWFAYGGSWDEGVIPPGLVRFYWNVAQAATPELVRALSGGLSDAVDSYALKVAVADRDVERPDRAVLYLLPSEVAGAHPTIRSTHRALRRHLRPRSPRMTLRLADGLAAAEDPDTGESFGEHRCRLLAEAVTEVGRPRRSGKDGAVDAVIEHLLGAGIDPARPHLRPGSTTEYRWPPS